MEAGVPPAPQGWYADPYGVAPLRWWDGATWTTHIAAPAARSDRNTRSSLLARLAPRGWRRWVLLTFVLLWLGSCGASLPYMDLPPGDYYSPVVVNDTSTAVRIASCADDHCGRFDSYEVEVQPKERTSSLLANTHGGTRFVAIDPISEQRLGCLTPSWSYNGEVDRSRVLRVAAATPCDQPVPDPGYPRWVIPISATSVVAAVVVLSVAGLSWARTRPRPVQLARRC